MMHRSDNASVLGSQRMLSGGLRSAILAAALVWSACAVAPAPLTAEHRVVPTPIDGQVTVVNEADKPVGNLIPVYVAVANGSDEGRTIHPSQVFALNQYGERIAPVPPIEAAREAGGANKLKAAVESGALGGAAEGAVGSAVGALAGLATGGVGPGAAIGGAVGVAQGALWSAPMGQGEAMSQANAQIQGLALNDTVVRKDFTVSGYVFFPKGSYTDLEMVVVNNETGASESVKVPWR
jgi:hypothetical protein